MVSVFSSLARVFLQIHGIRSTGNYQELNAIKFTIGGPTITVESGGEGGRARRLPFGSGNNRGGLKLWFHPIPLFFSIGGSCQDLLAGADHAYQWDVAGPIRG